MAKPAGVLVTRKILKIALLFILFWLVAFSGAIIHEYGHVATILACGVEVRAAGVAPGIILYPRLGFYRWQLWEQPIGWCSYEDPDVLWKAGLCWLMGSGATTIVGYLVLVAILILRPSRWKWIVLAMIVVVYTADLYLYAILPRLGLRHFIVIGGTNPEPLAGAVAMGVPEWLFFVLVAINILLVCSLLAYSLLRLKKDNTPSKNHTA